MSNHEILSEISLIAAADLSALQFRFVTVDSNGKAAQNTTAGGRVIGVNTGKPVADEVTTVAVGGVSKVAAGAVVAAGAEVASDNVGRAVTATTGDHIIGTALKAAGAADEVIPVLLGQSATA